MAVLRRLHILLTKTQNMNTKQKAYIDFIEKMYKDGKAIANIRVKENTHGFLGWILLSHNRFNGQRFYTVGMVYYVNGEIFSVDHDSNEFFTENDDEAAEWFTSKVL